MKDKKNFNKRVNEASVLDIINETLSPKKKEALYKDFCNSCKITKDGMYKALKKFHNNPDLIRLKVLANHISGGSIDELFKKIYPNNKNKANF